MEKCIKEIEIFLLITFLKYKKINLDHVHFNLKKIMYYLVTQNGNIRILKRKPQS